MTMRSNRFITRIQPPADKDDPKAKRRADDLGARDLQRQIGELEDAIPGDKTVRVEFRSKGPNAEIAVSLPRRALERRFDAYEIMRQNNRGSLWIPRSSLQIGDKLIFATDAPVGTSFVVRVYALEPGRGTRAAKATASEAPPLPPVLDSPDPPPTAIQETQQAKKKKKSGK